MKQVIQNYKTGELKVTEVPAPGVRNGQLLVANRFSLISAGTEKSTVSVAQKSLAGKAMERPDMVKKVLGKVKKDGLVDTMKMVFARLDAPAALGYSTAGVVLAVGKDCAGFAVGDRVACAGQNYASHADVVSVPKNLCTPIPDGVSFEQAAYVALGSIAMQGVRQAEPQLGDAVAVIGLGLLGQLTVQFLKASGCRVLACDMAADKLELAQRFGADQTVLPDQLIDAAAVFSQGQGVDSVIITASTKSDVPVSQAGDICRKKGRVVVVGAVGMNVPRAAFYVKELELRLSSSYGPGRYDAGYEEGGKDYPYGYVRWTEGRNMHAFLQLIASGQVDVNTLTSHTYAIDQAEQAYELIMQGSEPYLGILLSYPDEGHTANALQRRIMVAPAQTRKLTVGLLGAGNHVRDMLLPALQKEAEVRLHAVCTGTGANARALGDKLGSHYCTTDYQEVLADDQVNAVLIGTRHNSHARFVLDALQANKHVFVEKPLCLTEAERLAIAQLYAEKASQGVQLLAGFNRRFSSHAGKIKQHFHEISDPLVMSYRVNAGAIPADHWIQDPAVGGGRILGEGCHFIDLMVYLSGARVNSVHARRIAQHSSGVMDDQCIISLGFTNGSVGTLIYAAGGDGALDKERFEVFGGGRVAVLDDYHRTDLYQNGQCKSFKTGKRDKGFGAEMQAWVQACTQGKSHGMDFAQIDNVTQACLLAVDSLSTGTVHTL